MARRVRCGPAEARAPVRRRTPLSGRRELATTEDDASAWHNVAAGNAVLAGIAAADALCCALIGQHSQRRIIGPPSSSSRQHARHGP